ncbi:MAG: CARDB domain-containing protein [Bacteroides sp.]
MRRWLNWRYGLLLPLLAFLALNTWAQSPDIPDWVASPGVDENGNKIYYYQGFEDKNKVGYDKSDDEFALIWEKREGIKPRDWSDNRYWKDYHLSSNNVFIQWQIKAQGGNGIPFKSAKGRLHLRYYALDDEAISAILLPVVNLSQIEEPKLRFMFSSPSRTNVDKLVVKYRLYSNDPWKELGTIKEKVEEFEWREFDLKAVKAAAMKENLSKGKIFFALEGHTHLGGGLNIDELMIVDVAGKPSTIGRTEFVQLDNPLGHGTKLNELARLFFEVKSGSGHFKLKELNLEFQGNSINDAAKYYLYHTTTPYFSPDQKNLYGELTINGNKFTLPATPKPELEKLFTGPHYFWVVADLKNEESILKHTMTFKLPSEEGKAVTLKYYDIANQPKTAADVKLPRKGETYPYSETTHATIYKCLFQEDFEGNSVSSDWQLVDGVWKVGTPQEDPSKTLHKTAPTTAFSGSKVLATAMLKEGKLDGNYVNGLRPEASRALYKKEAGIVADFYKDIRFKAKYCLNSKPDDKFRLVLITDKTANGTQQDIETVVWESSTRSVMSGWNLLNVDLSRVASRCKKFRFRFELETDNDENQSGLFLDDIQILGEFIQNDLGIVSLEVPKDFTMGSTSKVKVKVKNFGKEQISGTFTLKVNLNGKETTKTHNLTTPLQQGEETEVEIDGLELTPNESLSNQKLLTVTVVLPEGKKDDDPSNDRAEARFYAFPTYEISSSKEYPKDKYARLLHWYPEAKSALYQSSWVEADIDQQEKFNIRVDNKVTPKEAYKNPPYSHSVWTTGTPRCNQSEHSYLTGPFFKLEEATDKEFIIAYAYEKDASTPLSAQFWIEYRTETNPTQWQKLPKGGWFQNWYENNSQWSLTEDTNGFQVAKTQLPNQTGKIQFRIVFEAGMPTAGVTISGFEVRPMRADLQITKIKPDNTNPCNGYGSDNLKVTVKNNGPEVLKPFSCPATVRVYEYKNGSEYNKQNIDVTNTANFELRGEHNITLEFTSDLAKSAEKEFDTKISYPWDASDWGYRVVVSLHPENKGKPDEDATNNVIAKDIVSLKPPYQIVKDLAPGTAGSLVYYVESFPHEISTIQPSQQHFTLQSAAWNALNGAEGVVLGNNFNITKAGKLKVTYKLTSSYKYNGTSTTTCDQSLEFEVKQTTVKLKVTAVKFKDQEEPEKDYGCYYNNGETVDVTVTSDGGSRVENATLKFFINGQPQTLTVTPQTLTANASHTFTVTGVKIPKGYSQFEVLATAGTGENVSSYTNRYHADRLFRSVKEKPTMYWMKRGIPASIEPVPSTKVVNNYVGQVDLYVAPVKGAKYEWYKGPTGTTTTSGLTKVEGQTTNTFPLPEESAVYAVKVIHGKCDGEFSDIISVRSDDIELLNFTGIAKGVCAEEGKLPLSLDIRNNSRTTYDAGQFFTFEVKVEWGGTTHHTQTFDYKLPVTIQQSSVTNHTVITLTTGQFNPAGDNTVTLTFKGVKRNANETVVADGNVDNNTLTSLISVRQSPSITLAQDVIKKKFNPATQFTLSPTYSDDVTEYAWEAWDDEHNKYTMIGGSNTPTYQVNGLPKDKYRVTAKNSSGCASQKEITIIQTDLQLTEIVSPKSACDIKKELGDYVDLKVRNTGSKAFKDDVANNTNVKLRVTITLDGANLKSVDMDLPRELYEVNKEVQLPRIQIDNLVDKLTSGTSPHSLKAEFMVLQAEDIEPANNQIEVSIQEYGTPSFKMVYTKKSADGTSTSKEITDGEVLEYYDVAPTEFKFDNVSVSNVSYIWEFGKDNLFSSKSRIMSGVDADGDGLDDKDNVTPVQPLANTSENLYNEYTKANSIGKQGSGFYYMKLETVEGCSATQGFELKVLSVDLTIESIEAPRSACNFVYTTGVYRDYPQVKVNVKNAGTKDIPRETQLDVKCSVYKDIALQELVKTLVPIDDNGQNITYTLDKDLRKGDAVTVSLPFDINSVTEHDGKKFYFKAEVHFITENFKEKEFLKDNNSSGYKELDPKLKTFMMEDYPDVKINSVTAKDLDLTNTENQTLLPSGTYRYELEYNGKPNKVTLEAPYTEADYTYQWGFSYGLQIKSTDPSNPNKDFTKSRTLDVDGSGYFNLTLVSKKGCKGDFKASIEVSGGDIFISEVMSPAAKACFEGVEGRPISFKIMNVGILNFTSESVKEGKNKIDVTCELMKKGVPTDLLKGKTYSVFYADPKWETPSSGISVPSNSEIEVTLPVKMPAISEIGEYVLRIMIVPSDYIAVYDRNKANNNREHNISFVGAPEIAPNYLTSGNFYTISTTLKLDQNAYTTYRNFSWTKPDGSKTPLNETSSVLEDVDVPGKYTLFFEDQYGCKGSQSTNIRFPGYLTLVPDAVTAPKNGCNIVGTSQDLVLRVQNSGKEDYEIPATGIPVEYKLWDPDAYDETTGQLIGEPTVWKPLLVTAESKTVKPTETSELSTATLSAKVVLPDKSAVLRKWNFKLQLAKLDTDESFQPGKVDRSPVASEIFDKPKPKMPNLAEQAIKALEKLQLIPPSITTPEAKKAFLKEIPLMMTKDGKTERTTFKLDANGYTENETYKWELPAGYEVKDKEDEKRELIFNRTGLYKVKVTSGNGCESESEAVRLRYKVEYTIKPLIMGDESTLCINKDAAKTPYEVRVKVTVDKADELIPSGTVFTFKFTVKDEQGAALGSEVVETKTIEENLAQGHSFEYVFTEKAQMPKGKSVIALSTSFNDGEEDYSGLGSKELRYVDNPVVTLPAEYKDTKSPVEVKPTVEGGEAPYTYTWNGKTGESSYSSEGGPLKLLVTDKNNCQAEANTVVNITYKLTLAKKGEGRVEIQHYDAAGTLLEGDLLLDGDALFQGRKLRVKIIPDVSRSYYLEYLTINDEKIEVDRTGKEYILEKITGNVTIEVGFKRNGGSDDNGGGDNEKPKSVEDALLAQVLCVSPVRENVVLLHTQGVARYEVLNSLGVSLLSGTNSEGSEQIVTSAQRLRAGVYLVRLYAHNGVSHTLRIVKE